VFANLNICLTHIVQKRWMTFYRIRAVATLYRYTVIPYHRSTV